jgi:glycogen debranching enzyme
MADFASQLGEPASPFREQASAVRKSFRRFWNPETGYCFDVLDTPVGNDPSLRPNQLFSVSLPHRPLSKARQKAVLDACSRHLLTPMGLRSLAPFEAAYVGRYGGGPRERDAAYHQGTVWGWLIGPYATAHLHIYHDTDAIRSLLSPLLDHLTDHAVGSVSEIFDADPPFHPRGAVAQAWSVAELLRVWQSLSTTY